MRYASIDTDGSITGTRNAVYDERVSFYCEARSGRIQLSVSFLNEAILRTPRIKATLSTGSARLDVDGEPIPGNDESPKFLGTFTGTTIVQELEGAEMLNIIVRPTRISLPLSTLGDKASAFAQACDKGVRPAAATTSPFIGTWGQIRSNAGDCPTCLVSIVPFGDALRITANNGWSATVRGNEHEVSGEGNWPTSGVWSGPLAVELHWEAGELHLAMTALNSNASLTASYIRSR
ncbi:hypothetical protein PY365_12495 [Roseiarcaceae bacterium H3SJ34-1]|uniref:hypothetical protein n=1 Tax=Terripilifer ovatus TaxID=3032367 RepID=UPI003AB98B4C|nr:hypothetical protein [Roseiarcaceae bacterium H3SJ34-1]